MVIARVSAPSVTDKLVASVTSQLRSFILLRAGMSQGFDQDSQQMPCFAAIHSSLFQLDIILEESLSLWPCVHPSIQRVDV